MSRSRNVKPGFFKNEDLAELPFWVRLLYIGIWIEADRDGRFEDRPVKLKMAIFPADSVDVDAGLTLLADSGFIYRYASQTKRYGQVVAWKKHQNPHFKEQMSVIPSPESLGLDVHARAPKPEASGVMDEPKASGILAKAVDDADASNKRLTKKPEALPPMDGGVNRADSLIPDSLIPDSLIPDPLEEREKPHLVKPRKDDSVALMVGGFEDFWALYPRKVAKAAAIKAWEKIKQTPELLAAILAGVANRAATEKWRTEPEFIPHPATWLNAKRWEDDLSSERAIALKQEPASKTRGAIDKLQEMKNAKLDPNRDRDGLSKADDFRLRSPTGRRFD